MNLAIDIGNSFSKLGIFDGANKLNVIIEEALSEKSIRELIHEFGVKNIIYSTVAEENIILQSIGTTANVNVIRFTPETNMPVRIDYMSPETLGSDRIAGILAAYNKYGNSNVLVIDAGTAITYDVLSSVGVYEGGNISPGLSTRFRSLNNYTKRLPLIGPENSYDILGKDTESAIRSGVQQGLVFEINEYIRTFENLYSELKIIITGGDAELLSGLINSSIEVSPDLVIEGLNFIVNYNA